MGCDIHLVLEKKWKSEEHGTEIWVGVEKFRYAPVLVYPVGGGDPVRGYPHHDADSRNYELFAKLAGVRDYSNEGPHVTPKGMPDDASDLALMESEGWGDDGHSHSYCSLKEYVEALLATTGDPEKLLVDDDPRTKDPYEYYFGVHREELDLDEYRVVFWFDN